MYAIRERMFRLGEDSDITDEAGQPVLHVDGKVLSLHNRLFLTDPAGREVGQVHRKLAALRPAYEINLGGRDVAEVRKHLFTPFGERFTIGAPALAASPDAVTGYGRAHGITVIDGGCPLMFAPTADVGHKIMRLVYAGHLPKHV
jgi:LURP-one-related